jgi:hypothetical protein
MVAGARATWRGGGSAGDAELAITGQPRSEGHSGPMTLRFLGHSHPGPDDGMIGSENRNPES